MSVAKEPLLIELGTEELPVKALPGLAQAFFDNVIDGLAKRGIAFDRGEAKPLYSPRRLRWCCPAWRWNRTSSAAKCSVRTSTVALDADGSHAGAAGFRAEGRRGMDRAGAHVRRQGRAVRRPLGEAGREDRDAAAGTRRRSPRRDADPQADALGRARLCIRADPVHWLVAAARRGRRRRRRPGRAGRTQFRGHRFLHDKPVWIGAPRDYVDALRGAKVLVDPTNAAPRSCAKSNTQQRTPVASRASPDDNLAQVLCLVEWPSAILCGFDEEFLAVPQEALIATMEDNQKFFPVLDADGAWRAASSAWRTSCRRFRPKCARATNA
jgi:glycyl-tRNA synthetase beta chain